MRTTDPREFSLRIGKLAEPLSKNGWCGATSARESWEEVIARWDQQERTAAGKWIRLYCLALGRSTVPSIQRLPLMLRLFRRRPPTPEVFWGVLERMWNHAVFPAHADLRLQSELLEWMRSMHQPAKGRAIRVYRGAAEGRIHGLSWTTRRRVAETFGRWQRGLGRIVIATALVPASGVFMRVPAFKESEVVLDPEKLERLHVEPFPEETEKLWSTFNG